MPAPVLAFGLCLFLGAGGPLLAQAPRIKVTSIDIQGADAYSEARLKDLLSTRSSGFWPWSDTRYFDRETFEADLDRLVAFYADHGYPDARVTGIDPRLNTDQTSIAITLTIEEGAPRRIESVALEGFDPIGPDEVRELHADLPIRPADVRTAPAVREARNVAVRRLNDHGYPQAAVTVEEREVAEQRLAVTLTARPGPQATFGPVTIGGNTSVDSSVIERALTIEPGALFSRSAMQRSQRRLYDTDLFRIATVEARQESGAADLVPVQVSVVEGKRRRLEFSGGYGTDERLRGGITWRHLNFFGDARTATIEGKWSSLDRGLRSTLTQPHAIGPDVTLSVSGQRWFADEPGYKLDTRGGRVALTRQFTSSDAADPGLTSSVSASVMYEQETFAIGADALTDLSFRDELIALGLDPRTGVGQGRLTAIAFDTRTTTVVDPLDSRQGFLVEAHVEKGGGWLPGSYDYLEATLEGRHFLSLGAGVVVANRVRVGSIRSGGPAAENIPFFKRYFLGGSSSLRGWGRFQVAPLSGSGLPLGGHSMLELSSELRIGSVRKIGIVAFVDAGNAWTESWHAPTGLRADAGPGVRYDTPVGPLRADFAYQLTPIEGLLIDGMPETRHWRLQFSIGQAF